MTINIPNYLQVLLVSDHFIEAIKKIRKSYGIPIKFGYKTSTEMEKWKNNLLSVRTETDVDMAEELFSVQMSLRSKFRKFPAYATKRLQLQPVQPAKLIKVKIKTTKYALFLDEVKSLFNTYTEIKKEHQAFVTNYILFGNNQPFDINLFAKEFTDNIQFYIRRRRCGENAPEDRIIIEMDPSADFEDLIKKRGLLETLREAIFPQTRRRQIADRNKSLEEDIANYKALQKDKKTEYTLDPGERKPSAYKNVLAQQEDNPTSQQGDRLRQRTSRLQRQLLKDPEKSKEYKPKVSTKLIE